jgi:hypothetical protein
VVFFFPLLFSLVVVGDGGIEGNDPPLEYEREETGTFAASPNS